MSTIERFAGELVRAHETGGMLQLDPELDAISVEDGAAVQEAMTARLGATVAVSKIAINKTGRAVAAPMYGSLFTESGGTLPARGVIGLEVEIAIRLGRDVTPELAADGEAGLLSAIDQFLVGIELIGSRLENFRQWGVGAGLADNLFSAGYVLNRDEPWQRGTSYIDAMIEVEIDGRPAYSALATHPFGGVLVALEQYAKAPFDRHGCCKAGSIITTGTLCGLVPTTGPCAIVTRLGGAHETRVRLV